MKVDDIDLIFIILNEDVSKINGDETWYYVKILHGMGKCIWVLCCFLQTSLSSMIHNVIFTSMRGLLFNLS